MALLCVVGAHAGWEAATPASAPLGTATANLTGLGALPSGGEVDLRSAVIGRWDERGGSGIVLTLASNGVATFDLKLDGTLAWSESGTFKVLCNDVTVSCLVLGQMAGGYAGASTHETCAFRHGLLLWPADGDVFTRQG